MADDTIPAVKRCSKCGESKPAAEFYRRKTRAGRECIYSECKFCIIKRQKAHYTANKDKLSDYYKEYRKRHAEKIRRRRSEYFFENHEHNLEINRAYKSTRRAELAAKSREYAQLNPGKVKDAKRRRYELNRDEILKKNRTAAALRRQINHDAELARERAYRERNPDRIRVTRKRWKLNNPHAVQAQSKRRRALKSAVPGSLSASEWRSLVERSSRCHWCKRKWTKERRPTLDHVVPLSKGGLHVIGNAVCSCRSCNSRKNNRLANPLTAEAILL
jgi:hypothetical protein